MDDGRDELERYYRALIRQARAGDRDSAMEFLREFASTGARAPAEAAAYLGECIARWSDAEFRGTNAPRAFNIAKVGRPEDAEILERHIRALRAYFLLRGRHSGHDEAIHRAAQTVPFTESSMRKLVEETEHDTKREAALWLVKANAVRRRCRRMAGLPLPEDAARPRNARQ